jgi:hypothetical protein
MPTPGPAMHDFEWQESDRAITIRCLLPLWRRRFLAAFLLAPLLWLGPLLLRFWLIEGGIHSSFLSDGWPLLQALSSEPGVFPALAGNLLGAMPLAWLIHQATLLTPDTTLRFDKRVRRLTISQMAPAVPPRTITVPFDAVKGVSAERWIRSGFHVEPSDQPDRWFLEIRCRDGRRFRTPATENSSVIESCALRIRNGALTAKTVGVPNPPQRDKARDGFLKCWVVLSSVALFLISGPVLSDQVLHQKGSVAMAWLQQKSSAGERRVQLRYTFVVPSGREIDASRSVDPKLADPLKVGDWLAVRYSSAHPEQNVLLGEERVAAATPLVANLFCLFFLAIALGDALAAASPGKPWRLGPRDGWW